jgi:DNA-binding NarL/FixJ family response regulator
MARHGGPGCAVAWSGGESEGDGAGGAHDADDPHAGGRAGADAVDAAAAVALEAVARQLRPVAATFLLLDPDGRPRRSVVHRDGPRASVVADWQRGLRDVDPLPPRVLARVPRGIATFDDVGGLDAVLARGTRAGAAYRRIGVVDDLRLRVRRGERLLGAVTLWRPLAGPRWTASQLALAEALQPLVEHAHLEAAGAGGGAERLPAGLTPRERDVARLIAGGATNAEIARALHVSLETVKTHASAILLKLGARSRREVMRRLAPDVAPTRTPQEDAEVAERLLGTLLRWSRERVDGVAGGWAVLSGRGVVVADAVALAAAAAPDPRRDPGRPAPAAPDGARDAARELHEALFAPGFVRELLVAEGSPTVVAATAAHPRAERVAALAATAGWTAPTTIVVRLHGRVAGLVWLARARRSRSTEERALADVRAMQPLVEAATAPLLRRALARPPVTADGPRTTLTAREWDVARRSVAGATNAEIARALGIAEATVKGHMTRVMVKCGVRSRAQLIALMRGR